MALITDLKAKSIKPEGKAIPHGAIPGLLLRPTNTKGRGKWTLRYTSPATKKARAAGLGVYPEVSIAEAVKRALEFREKLANNIDPLDEKINNLKCPTFEEASLLVHKALSPSWKNSKHADQWINTLAQYAFPKIGMMRIDTLTPAHFSAVLSPFWLEKQETAGRVKQRMHAVMDWAVANGHCTHNPVSVVSKLLPKQEKKLLRVSHHPSMPVADIQGFIKKLSSERQTVTKQLLLFLILTATRSGEARGAKWSEFDLTQKKWVIPAERMKAKVSHEIPLSKQAIELLESVKKYDAELVFPSASGIELSDMTLTSFLRKNKVPSDTPERFATAHGFRSTFKNWAMENGYSESLSERALAHTVKNQTEAAYNRTKLFEQRRPLMQDWADFLFGKVGTSTNN